MFKFNVDDLIQSGLVTSKESPCGRYRLMKYHSKVFYNNLWDTDHRLLQCRGIVVDRDDNVIMYPFDKIFNYGENGTGYDLNPRAVYRKVEKRNGFLAQAAMVEGELLVTSSGSFTSEHRDLAYHWITTTMYNALGTDLSYLPAGFTFMFEICDQTDPHIVAEESGAYLIGARETSYGRSEVVPEITLDQMASHFGFLRPAHELVTLEEAIRQSRFVKHEGFILRDLRMEKPVLKLKSKHYLSKKAMMRMGKKVADSMFNNPEYFRERLDEEFYEIHKFLIQTYTVEEWVSFTEKQRRFIIEGYFQWS